MKTAEEIFDKYCRNKEYYNNPAFTYKNIITAIEEYASQFRQEVSDNEIEEKCSKLHYSLEAVGFGEGARWMRNRMKGGEK